MNGYVVLQISFHQGLCKKFYPNFENDDSTLASSTILTFRNILNYISRNTQRVRKLSFSKTIIDSQAITQLAQVPLSLSTTSFKPKQAV